MPRNRNSFLKHGRRKSMKWIESLDELPRYSPPGHSGTVNRRLVDGSFCGNFEMVLGEIAPGGAAERHAHETEYQVIYIISGEADVTLGDQAPRRCGPGTVVRIPPKLEHEVIARGAEPLRLIVL